MNIAFPSDRILAAAPKKGPQNPTFYRHASEYIELLRTIRWKNVEDDKVYGFQPQWANSVDTYVQLKSNWRQVHMLVKKIELPIETEIPNCDEDSSDELLLETLRETHIKQDILDARLLKLQRTAYSAQEAV